MQVLLAMATVLSWVLMVRPSSGLLIGWCSRPWIQGGVGSSWLVLHQDCRQSGAPGHAHRVVSGPHCSSLIRTADMQVLQAMDTGLGRVLIVRSSSG